MSAIEQISYYEEYIEQPQPAKVESYVLKLDRDKYQEAETLRFTDPDRYFELMEQLNAYTQFQMETNIGERLNVLQSTYRYDIREKELYGENTHEPFLDVIKRGRDYRKEHGNPQDHARENAEVIGMEKIQNILCDDDAEIGTTMISISPPGGEESIYQHNFYDVFTLKEDNRGVRYVEASRYSASLSSHEYIEKVQELNSSYSLPIDEKEDVYFLANPVALKEKGSDLSGEIHRHMHADHAYMERDDFELVLDMVHPYIQKYVEALQDDPYNEQRQGIIYNAILNKADEAAQKIEEKRQDGITPLFALKDITEEDILYYGTQQVRALDVGCGFSGGYEVDMFGNSIPQPFSVAEFAGAQYSEKRTLKCTCPMCGKKVEARIGGGRITCPACKASAPYKC